MPEAKPTKSPSTASSPDLDWSQVRETVLMLYLAVAQIEVSMRDGEDSVNHLTDSFTSMVGSVQTMEFAASDLPDDERYRAIKDTILQNCQTVSQKMAASIMAFQFYDKLAQRLAHVSHSLHALAELVVEPTRSYNPYEWHGLQEKIKSTYSMREERMMFDAILNGASLEEALAVLHSDSDKADPTDQTDQTDQTDPNDVELF